MPAHQPQYDPATPRLRAAAGLLLLDGAPWLMRAAEFGYFRIERRLWERDLAKLKRLGCNAVTTYIPWIWHEHTAGHFDFAGVTHPQRDLLGFLQACKAEGLPVVVKPGPFIYAEYDGLGHPRWLEGKIPQALMCGPKGQPVRGDFWAAYSLGHPAYRAAVQGWYQAVADILADFWQDPVIGWQLDNETGFLYANGLGKWDFNANTVGRFRYWLKGEYRSIDKLNDAWGSKYADFDAIEPPRLPSLRRGLVDEWQRFFQSWVQDYLDWLRATALAAGVPVPLTLNDSANFQPPTDPAAKAASGAAELYGCDIFIKITGADTASDYPWGSACSPAYFRGITPPDKPLIYWQLGAGWPDPRSNPGDDTLLQNLFGGLAHGLKGFSLYPAHDGAEPTGEPYTHGTVFNRDGTPGPRYAVAERALRFLSQYERELLASQPLASEKPVGFAFHYPDFRFRAEDFLPLIGQPDPCRILALTLAHFGIYAALTAAGYGPSLRLFDLQHASDDDLAACRVIVMPSKGNMDPATFARLRRYVENGGQLVTTGIAPTHDLLGRPLDSAALYPHGRAAKVSYPGRLPLLLSLGWQWMGKYLLFQRRGLKWQHPTSMHLLDTDEPLAALMRSPQFATRLLTNAGTPLRGDYMATRFGGRGRVLLRRRGKVAGYAVAVGAGTSTVIGSQPGGSYFTPQYYHLSPAERHDIRGFWRDLLTNRGAPAPLTFADDLDLEVQVRETGGRRLLFVLNRLALRQRGRITVPDPPAVAETLFSWRDAGLRRIEDGTLAVDMPPLAVLVARLA